MGVPKFNLYITASVLAVVYQVYTEFNEHQQVYPAVIALTNNKYFGIYLTNGAFATLIATWTAIRYVVFGTLELAERQKLMDTFFSSFIETIIALTYFRNAVSTGIAVQLVLTCSVKMFHTLCRARLETMERSVGNNVSDFVRLSGFLFCLFCIDAMCVASFASKVLEQGINIQTLFLLEFSNLLITSIATGLKLVLHQYEIIHGDAWESKSTYRFYIEIGQSLLNCVMYIAFFIAMCTVTTLPLHLVRELYINVIQAVTTLKNFSKYQKLANNIDLHFKDATNEELEDDRTCAICYDEMLNDTRVKRLPCGHMFHRHCLRRWFEKNTICPYCRREAEELLKMQVDQETGRNNAAAAAENAVPAQANGVAGDGAAPGGAPQPPAGNDAAADAGASAAFALYKLMMEQRRQQGVAGTPPSLGGVAPPDATGSDMGSPQEGSMPTTKLPPAATAQAAPAAETTPTETEAPAAATKVESTPAAPSPPVADASPAPPAARSRLLNRPPPQQDGMGSPMPSTASAAAAPQTPLSPAHTEELDAYREYHEALAAAQDRLQMRLERSKTMSWEPSN